MNKEGLKKAVEFFGSQAALARAISRPPQIVDYWLNHSKKGCSAEAAIAIERASNGLLGRHEIRPDIFDQPQSGAA